MSKFLLRLLGLAIGTSVGAYLGCGIALWILTGEWWG